MSDRYIYTTNTGSVYDKVFVDTSFCSTISAVDVMSNNVSTTEQLRDLLERVREEDQKKEEERLQAIQEENNRLRSMVKDVKFNGPATIVFWNDGTKTVVKRHELDHYDAEKGVLACMAKKLYNDKNIFNEVIRKYVPIEEEPHVHGSTVAEYAGCVNQIIENQQEEIERLKSIIDVLNRKHTALYNKNLNLRASISADDGRQL